MSIISQESFDNLPKEEKEKIIKDYQEYALLSEEGIDKFDRNDNLSRKKELERLFGKENLQSKPKIKTWEDVEKKGLVHADTGATYLLDVDKNHYTKELALKALATLQIAKLIELGYGGMVTAEEWKDENIRKFSVVRFEENLSYAEGRGAYEFVSFHTPEQREEFMSHESNRKLVEQYYMI